MLKTITTIPKGDGDLELLLVLILVALLATASVVCAAFLGLATG